MPNLTEAQTKAIEYNGSKSVTLSAAAGSGKTFVLINRIIEKLKNGGDISKLLVVTFTVDAANEIKTRISKALKDELKKDPQNNLLYIQSQKVKNAEIFTIDSFCQRTLRTGFDKAGISPDFKICDSAEYSLLKKRVAEETVDFISGKAEYRPLFENFLLALKNDDVEEILINAYDYFNRLPSKKDYKAKCLELLDAPYSSNVWLNKAFKDFEEYLLAIKEEYIALYKKITEFNADTQIVFEPMYKKDIYRFDELILNAKTKNQQGIVAELSNKYANFPSKCEQTEEYFNFKKFREKLKKKIIEKTNCFKLTETEYLQSNKKIKEILSCLFNAEEIYKEKLLAELKASNMLYFDEISRKCFELLISDVVNGKIIPSETAKQLSLKYEEILIDEYQDTNDIQDMIFRAISNDEKNIFVVGDEKQSIYGFRGTNPLLFAARLQSKDNENIMLSSNFRSRNEILEFVNIIFNEIMRKDTGFMNYKETDMLVYGADCFKEGKGNVNLVLINQNEENDEDFDTDDDDGENNESNIDLLLEIKYIANEILHLIRKKEEVFDKNLKKMRPIKLSDIVIMSRNLNNRGADIIKTLSDAGIPAYCNDGTDFYEKYEINAVLSLLTVINNNKDNIALAAAMRSPLFGFTDSELMKIRLSQKDEKEFYNAVLKAAETNVKVSNFIEKITKYRCLSEELPVNSLLNIIYNDLKAEAVFSLLPHGEERLRNINELIFHAEAYEKTGEGGLFSYIEYVKELLSKKGTAKTKGTVKEGDFVKVITIHSSKGLEYPVCFLCGLFKKFNFQEKKDIIKFNKDFGISMKLYDLKTNTKKATLQDETEKILISETNIKEEIRLLYVAFTRARERLYIVGSGKNIASKLDEWTLHTDTVPPWKLKDAKSYADIILPVLFSRNEVKKGIFGKNTLENPCKFKATLINEENVTVVANALKTSTNAYNEIKYLSEKEILKIPEKISVSELKARKNDTDINESVVKRYHFTQKPLFLAEKQNGRDKGNAIHKFLRYCNIERILASNSSISDEIELLDTKNVFSKAEKKALSVNALEEFFKNPMTARIFAASQIYREKRFTINFKANEIGIDDSSDDVIVQGIIDLFVINKNGITLIDFKTDKVLGNPNGEELIEKYSVQLELYKQTLERLYEKPVTEEYIYSFALNKYIKL